MSEIGPAQIEELAPAEAITDVMEAWLTAKKFIVNATNGVVLPAD